MNGKEKKIPILYASSNEYPTEGMIGCNLLEFPEKSPESKVISIDQETYNEAVNAICSASRITVKTGGGAAILMEKY